MRKYLLALLLIATLVSLVVYSEFAPALGLITLFLTLALSTYAIIHKHAGTENARAKILKELGVMVITLLIALFLGGIAGTLANYQASMRWGEVAGIVSAVGASFMVGYLVRKGLGRFNR